MISTKRVAVALVVSVLVGLGSWAIVAWGLAFYGLPFAWASLAGGVVGAVNGRATAIEIMDPDCELDDE